MKNSIKAEALCQYALDAVGGGYCYGASGEVCSESNRTKWAQWNPSQASNLLGVCQKWDGKRVWDCSGLFRGAWRSLASYRSGGATTIYRERGQEKGIIATMPDVPGIAVLRGDAKTKEHIGLYVGNGMVVDARGSKKGVLHAPISAYPGGWTHWLHFDEVEYAGSTPEEKPIHLPQKARVTGVRIGLNLRTSNRIEKNTILLIPEGAVVEFLWEEGDFALVRYQEEVGYVSRRYLSLLKENGL